jgi:hypothetical protein
MRLMFVSRTQNKENGAAEDEKMEEIKGNN